MIQRFPQTPVTVLQSLKLVWPTPFLLLGLPRLKNGREGLKSTQFKMSWQSSGSGRHVGKLSKTMWDRNWIPWRYSTSSDNHGFLIEHFLKKVYHIIIDISGISTNLTVELLVFCKPRSCAGGADQSWKMSRESADEGDQAQTEATKIVLNHSENILS